METMTLTTRGKVWAVASLALAALAAVGALAVWRIWQDDEPLLGAMIIVLVIVIAVMLTVAAGSVQDDLRARERMERALQASEARITGIVNIAADAIISVDARQRIIG